MIDRLRSLLTDYLGEEASDDEVLRRAIEQIERLQSMDAEIEETGLELFQLIEAYEERKEAPDWHVLGLELWRQGVVSLSDLGAGSEQAVFDAVDRAVM